MKFIRVNMSNQTIAVQDVPQDYIGLGGRGLPQPHRGESPEFIQQV